jgi:hypothetical protein
MGTHASLSPVRAMRPGASSAWVTGMSQTSVLTDPPVVDVLRRRCGPTVLVLPGRRIGRRDGVADLLAVTPSGVAVVGVLEGSGEVETHLRGGLLTPAREVLAVGGTDRTAVVDAVERQVMAVRDVVGQLAGGVTVTPLLCAGEAGLPVLSTLRVRGIPVLAPGALATLLERPGRLSLEDRAGVAATLTREFPATY